MRSFRFAGALLASAVAFAAPQLAENLAAWKAEIEQASGARIAIGWVSHQRETNVLTLPAETELRPLFANYLRDENFVREFMNTHAMTVSVRNGLVLHHLIFINGGRQEEWNGEYNALVAHELGHAWLKALSYPVPIYQAGPQACLSIHSGDIVQHILIRAELERRKIDHIPLRIAPLGQLMERWKATPPENLAPCTAVQLTALWVDVRLGVPATAWPEKERFEQQIAARYPKVHEAVNDVTAILNGKDVTDKGVHRFVLAEVFNRLKTLAATTASKR